MKKHFLVWVAIGLLLIIFGLIAAFRPDSVPALLPQKSEIVQTVVGPGRIIPLRRMNIGSVILGTVKSVPANEGDVVKAGDLLAELDGAEAHANVQQAEAILEQARARLNQLTKVGSRVAAQNAREAELRLHEAEDNYAREQKLFAAKATPEQSLERARIEVGAARARHESAMAQAAGSNGVELRQAMAAVSQAGAALEAARARRNLTRIVAPLDGTVLTRNIEPGDVVNPGASLFDFAATGALFVSADIEEGSLGLLRTGQQARVVADAFPDRVFQARLEEISPLINAERGTVATRLRIENPDSAVLRVGMSVTVSIESGRKADALVLPNLYVRDLGTGRPWALVVENGKASRRDLSLGLRGEEVVEIKEGLTTDTPVLPGTSTVDVGKRVVPEF